MSPLSIDLLSVFLAPSEVSAVRRRGPRRIVEKIRRPVEAAGRDWSPAIEAFGAMLSESACKRVRVVVSSHLAQYELMPWREDLLDREEEEAAARAAFAETLGDAPRQWTVRVADEPPGTPRVAAAIETRLLDAMEAAAAAARTRIVSVQPHLVAAANAWRGCFGRERSSWFVAHERHRVCLAAIEGGRWRWLRCLPAGTDWAERLPQLVAHEMLLSGVEEALDVLVFAPAEPEFAVPGGTPFSFRRLQLDGCAGFSPASDGAFAPALIG